MTEEIKNDIDKLDGMTKIKGKCGYEIIGGCSDLRRLEQENKELKENLLDKYSPKHYDIAPKRQTVELYNKFDNLKNQNNIYRSALEEISGLASPHCTQCSQIINIINEVLK